MHLPCSIRFNEPSSMTMWHDASGPRRLIVSYPRLHFCRAPTAQGPEKPRKARVALAKLLIQWCTPEGLPRRRAPHSTHVATRRCLSPSPTVWALLPFRAFSPRGQILRVETRSRAQHGTAWHSMARRRYFCKDLSMLGIELRQISPVYPSDQMTQTQGRRWSNLTR